MSVGAISAASASSLPRPLEQFEDTERDQEACCTGKRGVTDPVEEVDGESGAGPSQEDAERAVDEPVLQFDGLVKREGDERDDCPAGTEHRRRQGVRQGVEGCHVSGRVWRGQGLIPRGCSPGRWGAEDLAATFSDVSNGRGQNGRDLPTAESLPDWPANGRT